MSKYQAIIEIVQKTSITYNLSARSRKKSPKNLIEPIKNTQFVQKSKLPGQIAPN